MTDIVWDVNETSRFNYRVAALVISEQRILLGRSKTDQYWHVLGGRVRIGETANDAVVREVFEELGLRVRTSTLTLVNENFFAAEGRHFHELGLYFACEIDDVKTSFPDDGGEHCGPEGDKTSFAWFPLDAITTVDLRPQFLRTLLSELEADAAGPRFMTSSGI